jgi:transposase
MRTLQPSLETEAEVRVTVGVDTHVDQHVAVALDAQGHRLGTQAFPATAQGFAQLLSWANTFGLVGQIGIEGTGSYGAGLARWLRARGLVVREV